MPSASSCSSARPPLDAVRCWGTAGATSGTGVRGADCMLSYRHTFHAGNHADVLKHITLLAWLDALMGKETPIFVLECPVLGRRADPEDGAGSLAPKSTIVTAKH